VPVCNHRAAPPCFGRSGKFARGPGWVFLTLLAAWSMLLKNHVSPIIRACPARPCSAPGQVTFLQKNAQAEAEKRARDATLTTSFWLSRPVAGGFCVAIRISSSFCATNEKYPIHAIECRRPQDRDDEPYWCRDHPSGRNPPARRLRLSRMQARPIGGSDRKHTIAPAAFECVARMETRNAVVQQMDGCVRLCTSVGSTPGGVE